MAEPRNPQADKFKEVARELGCDEDEGRWEERLRKVARQVPAEPATKPTGLNGEEK